MAVPQSKDRLAKKNASRSGNDLNSQNKNDSLTAGKSLNEKLREAFNLPDSSNKQKLPGIDSHSPTGSMRQQFNFSQLGNNQFNVR